jgi:AraC family chitin signaling transcriptional activator
MNPGVLIRSVPAVVAMLLFTIVSFAQLRYNQFHSIENVLSRELIKSIAKDGEGYVWIATDDGLLRYDGFQTHAYYRGLPSVYTKALIRRKNGQFCVLSDFGLSEINQRNDSVYFRPMQIGEFVFDQALNYPKSVYEDREGSLWIGEHNSIVRMNANGFRRFELGEDFRSIDYHRSFCFAEDAFGNLWIAPFKGPLLWFDRQREIMVPVKLDVPAHQFRAICVVKGDRLLVGAANGLLTLKIDSDHRILESTFDERLTGISSMVVLNDKDVFVGTRESGLHYFSLDRTNPTYEHLVNVPIVNIVDIYADPIREELWITGDENLGLIKPSVVSTLESVGLTRVESLTLGSAEELYFSTGEKLLCATGKDAPASVVLEVNDNYFERLFLEGSRLWIGDAFGGVATLDVHTRKMRRILEGNNVAIRDLYRDRQGNKWFTGHSRGLIRVDVRDSLTFFPELYQSVLVRESPDGAMYCASNGKSKLVSRWDNARQSFEPLELSFTFPTPDSLTVRDMQIDSLGTLWLGTDEGLMKMVKGREGQYVVEKVVFEGLDPNEPVRALAIDHRYLYVAHGQGLLVSRGDEYILYDQSSGLPSRIFEERGLVFDKNGDLLVATAKGLAIVRVNEIAFRRTETPLVKTLRINGIAMDVASVADSQFPYNSAVEASFISLAYPASNIVYQTRVAGGSQPWSEPSTNRNLSVFGFQEGSHFVEVRAREQGKLWSEPLIIPVSISKPWYRTWWAMVIFVALGLATVVAATQIHNLNLIRQKRNLQRIVEERTAEINRQKNEIIEQQLKIIQQKEELIAKNEAVYRSQQALAEADLNYMQLKEKQLREQIEFKNKQITTHALNIIQKNESLRKLKGHLETMVKQNGRIALTDIRRTLRVIDDSFRLDKDWEDFSLYFEQIHSGFYSKLKLSYPDLTPHELRHCALIRLNLTVAECASIMGISHDSIKVARSRLRKKLKLAPDQSLTRFIMAI